MEHHPTQKQVCFDLSSPGDLGDPLQLPDNLVSFLKWPEGATNEWCDTWGVTTPAANCLEMTEPNKVSGQWHTTPTRGARPKSIATSSGTTASRHSGTHCLMPDPINQPKEWVRACVAWMKETLHWWPELTMLDKECTGEISMTFTKMQAKRQAKTSFSKHVGGTLPSALATCEEMTSCHWKASRVPGISGR